MKLWRHICLVGLIGAVPLFVVAMTLIKASYSKQIDFGLQEQRGNHFQRPLVQLLVLLPRYQEAVRQRASGEASPGFGFSEIQQQVDREMDLLATNYNGTLGSALKFTDAELAWRKRENARLSVLQAAWNNLKQTPPAAVPGGEDIARMASSVRAMIAHAADTSNLILDNELDSYYLMDMTVSALPQAQQRMGDITLQAGNWLRLGKMAGNRTQVAVLAALLRQDDVNRIWRDAQTSLAEDKYFYGASDPLQKSLPPAIEKFNAASQAFLRLLDRIAAGETVSAVELETAGWNAQAESLRLWQTGADELDRLLSLRVHSIRSERRQFYLIIIGTLALVAVAMGVMIRKLLAAHDAEASKSAEILRAKEAQLRVIGDNLPDGMVYEIMRDFDGTMRFLYVSASVERLNGLSAEAVLRDGNLFHEQVLPEDRPKFLAARQESLANKSPFHVVARVRRADGVLRWMQFSSAPRRLPDGRFVWDGIETDITEYKLAEAALQASEMRFRSLSENSLTGIYMLKDWRVSYANPALERIFGYGPGELNGADPSQLFHPDDRARIAETFRRRMEGDLKPIAQSFHGLRKNGESVFVEVLGSGMIAGGQLMTIGNVVDITERRRSGAALAASENRFRTLIERAPVAISISRNGIRIYANQKLLELFGYTDANELIGQPLSSHWAPESRAMMEENIRQRSQGLPAPMNYEAVLLHKNGAKIPVQVAVTSVELPDGPASIGFATDISERKRAELQIQHLNRVYAVLSGINETIVRVKDPGAMLQAACRIAVEKGKFRMSWIGLLDDTKRLVKPVAAAGAVDGYLDLLKIDLSDLARREGPAGRAILSGGHVICNDLESDPSHLPWREEALRRGYRSSCALPLKVEGQVAGVFNLYADEPDFFNQAEIALLDELAMDIGFALEFHGQEDKRCEAEAAMKQSEERFARMFHNSPVPILLSRFANGAIVDANESFLHMSGFAREEVIGHTALELKLYPDPSVREKIIQHLREHGHLHEHEQLFRSKSGALRHHLLWMDLIDVSGEKFLLVIALDITEQKQAEQRQKQLEEQLRQTQKLEALGTLAGGIAHDFNNILGAIISFAELSRMDNAHNTELQENLGQVLKASSRATSLVRQILSFSRQQKHERTNLQLAPVVREALKLLRATLPATIEIQQNISGQLPDVLANPTQIHQVIMNLCTNAGHAMKNSHGRLTVNLALAHLEADCLPPVELKPGDYVRLSVSDTGHGMDEATVKRIFEPFFTTKGPGEGTGLGLSVVHGIIKEHQAQIMVESAPGSGTKFTMYFPPAAVSAKADELQPQAVPLGKDETIVFVDDEPALGEAAQKMLRRLGYQPVIFHSSAAAWEAIQNSPQNFDALISDLTMPGMTGMELARRVLEICPAMPVILTTGFSGAITRAKAQEKGVRELLHKPLEFQVLGSALNQVLHPAPALK